MGLFETSLPDWPGGGGLESDKRSLHEPGVVGNWRGVKGSPPPRQTAIALVSYVPAPFSVYPSPPFPRGPYLPPTEAYGVLGVAGGTRAKRQGSYIFLLFGAAIKDRARREDR